ncbi:MAG: hypothetical protein J0H80_01715, partial [Rhizobiales bacterium]|nr:hypothetical protein [Hyphomicrobiales bacterium]
RAYACTRGDDAATPGWLSIQAGRFAFLLLGRGLENRGASPPPPIPPVGSWRFSPLRRSPPMTIIVVSPTETVPWPFPTTFISSPN